jgi:DNA primase
VATLERWGVGYAPREWTALTEYLRGRGFREPAIESSGLAKRSSRGTLIDVFRDRVIFPARAPSGTVIGFIGRAAPDADGDVPKYLNCRETPLYCKGRVLFGLHEARPVLERGGVPVLVEGPADVLAVTAAGEGRYAGVAPCGTALTRDQVSALVRTAPGCDKVIVVFDGDASRQRAALRAWDVLRHAVAEPMTVVLPERQNPASVPRDELLHLLDADAVPLADLVTSACLTRFDRDMKFIDGKFNALDAVAAMPSREVARQVARAAEHTGLTTAEVTAAVTRALPRVVIEAHARRTR